MNPILKLNKKIKKEKMQKILKKWPNNNMNKKMQ